MKTTFKIYNDDVCLCSYAVGSENGSVNSDGESGKEDVDKSTNSSNDEFLLLLQKMHDECQPVAEKVVQEDAPVQVGENAQNPRS